MRRARRGRSGCQRTRWLVATAVLAMAAGVAADPADPAVDDGSRTAVVRELAKTLRERYVLPDVGGRAAAAIETRAAAGAYAGMDADALGEALTRDLREVARDKHLAVGRRPAPPAGANDPESRREDEARRMARDNFGVQKVEILPGNVGYLDLRFCPPAALGGETAIAAMSLLGNADALLVDLRRNGGGDPTQIALLSSYLFEEPTHLNDLVWREGNRTEQFWTHAWVPGKRLAAAAPVFVLTSGSTFSGGEEFANNLKVLKRATIVGETTGGGANPGRTVDLPGGMIAFVPTGRAVNPVTKTNWEGVGVEPDVKVSAADALKVAYASALERIAASTKDPERRAVAEWHLAGARAEARPVELSAAALAPLAGRYGPRVVALENGALFYQREGRPKRRLTALTEDTFAVQDAADFRVRFVTENGRVAKLVGLYEDGQTDESARTE